MSVIQYKDDLVQRVKDEFYRVFRERDLSLKKDREERARDLLLTNRGNYSKGVLEQIFDVVDHDPYAPNKRWFGQLLITPNRNRIYLSTTKSLSDWIETLIFSEGDLLKRLATAERSRPKGASNGVATLFLYLIDPKQYNVWLDATQRGLYTLGCIENLDKEGWDKNYPLFNSAAIQFRDRHGFEPQEVDWVLWTVDLMTQNPSALDRYRS
jgi:hypothetical protein